MRIWRMRFACWIPKATNSRSEYVILIGVPLQQRMHERASILRYTSIAMCCYSRHGVSLADTRRINSCVLWQHWYQCTTAQFFTALSEIWRVSVHTSCLDVHNFWTSCNTLLVAFAVDHYGVESAADNPVPFIYGLFDSLLLLDFSLPRVLYIYHFFFLIFSKLLSTVRRFWAS